MNKNTEELKNKFNARLESLADLPDNWDNCGSKPISQNIISMVKDFSSMIYSLELNNFFLNEDNVFPTSDISVVINFDYDYGEDRFTQCWEFKEDKVHFYLEKNGELDLTKDLDKNDIASWCQNFVDNLPETMIKST